MPTLGTVSVGSGTLNFSTGSNVTITTLNLTNAGTLTGTDSLTVTGVTTWSSASTMSGTGPLIAQGGLNISDPGGSGFVTLNTRTLENFGTATFASAGGNFFQMQNATVINEPGATWNITSEGFSVSSGTDSFNNQGTFNNSGTSTINVPFANVGSVAVNSGTLTLGDGGSSGAGGFTIAASSTLAFASSYTLNGTTQASGAGSVKLAAGALTLASGVTYDVTGGLLGAGGSATFGAGDTFGPSVVQSGGGTIVFGAGTTLPTLGTVSVGSGTLNFSTGSPVTITTLNLTNAGTLTGADSLTVTGVTDLVQPHKHHERLWSAYRARRAEHQRSGGQRFRHAEHAHAGKLRRRHLRQRRRQLLSDAERHHHQRTGCDLEHHLRGFLGQQRRRLLQ